MTNQPVSQGWAVLESGTQRSITAIYNFLPKQNVTSDVHGAFRVCAPIVPNPSAIVIVALDSSGKAYPPFVAPISGSTDLGIIPMGGCRPICGLDGQQQTSSPATITGAITSTPIAKTGAVLPQYVMQALDGSKSTDGYPNLWALAMPIFNTSQAYTFGTTPGTCAEGFPFCTAYTFSIPTQKPIKRVTGGYLQEAGAPDYSIYAVPDGTPSCIPSFGLEIFQQDGTSLLRGTPGVQLSAATINFTKCQ
ncbi:MAG TPA: hypothetical protein VM578_11975 [Candidatus Saccharimonadales bacterium]|nr:hypothetical protein [Candidatus Saccharimonadales bacterium]